MAERMTELESLKEDLYQLVNDLRTNYTLQCDEDEYVQVGRDESADQLNSLLREYEH